MKRTLLAVLAVVMAAVSNSVFASPQTVEGVVSDNMCGKQHMLPGKTDAQCVQECIGAHSKYALVVDAKVYTLSGTGFAFEKYAGKRVRVSGEIGKDAIAVGSIREVTRQ